MTRSLSPNQGGSDPRNLETIGRLHILQQVGNPSEENENSNPARKGNPLYVEISPHELNRLGEKKNDKDNKNEDNMTKGKKKNIRQVEDGLHLVVPAKIYGKSIRALTDSGVARCFITPSCVTTGGLKEIPRDISLELGNGEKFLSRGYIPEVPVGTAGLTVKVGFTVTNLPHEVDLVLGIN